MLSHFRVKRVIRSFILCSTLRAESPVGVELVGELHVWPFHSVTLWRAKKEKMGGRTPHCAGWIGSWIRLSCSLTPWVLAEASVRVVWACTRADRVAQGQEEVKRICQVCRSWNIITYRLKVTASLHTEISVLWCEGAGKLPVLSAAYYRVTSKDPPQKKWTQCSSLTNWFFCEYSFVTNLLLEFYTIHTKWHKLATDWGFWFKFLWCYFNVVV